MSIKKIFLANTFWTFLQQFGNQIITFFVGLILARLLNPADFGIIVTLTVFIAISNTIVYGGLAHSLIRTDEITDEDLSTVFWFNILSAIFIYIILFLSAPFVASFYKMEELTRVLRVFSLQIVIGSLAIIQRTIFTKDFNFKIQFLISLPSVLISSIFSVILAYNNFKEWSLVYGSLSLIIIETSLYWKFSKWRPKYIFSKNKFNQHFKFGYKLLLSSIIDTVFNNIYNLIIAKIYNPVQLAFYNRAETLKQLPINNLAAALNKVTYPLFAIIKNDDLALRKAYQKLMKMVIFLVAPIMLLMNALAEPLIVLLFTEKWLSVVPYLKIVCFNGILYPIHAYNLNILNVKGRSDLFLRLEIIKKVLVIALILLSLHWGIMGLLWSSVIASFLAFFINSYYSGKLIKYTTINQIKDIIPFIISGLVVQIIIVNFVEYFLLNFNNISKLIIGSSIGGILYLGMIYIFDKNSILEIINLLKKQQLK